jgi:hypothetical protein
MSRRHPDRARQLHESEARLARLIDELAAIISNGDAEQAARAHEVLGRVIEQMSLTYGAPTTEGS